MIWHFRTLERAGMAVSDADDWLMEGRHRPANIVLNAGLESQFGR